MSATPQADEKLVNLHLLVTKSGSGDIVARGLSCFSLIASSNDADEKLRDKFL